MTHHTHHEPQSFWTKYIFSQDHKVIAIQYTITALLVGLFGLVLSWLMRLQLGFPGSFQFLNPGSYYQMLTQHGMIMIVYLLTAILLGGFGNYLIPLMIGARDMAFPFLNMLSYWVYLVSVIVLMAAFFVPGGPTGAGWTLYPPLSALPNAAPGSGWGIKLMLISLVIFIAAATMGGLNYVTTVLQCRTKGMTLMRMPLSVWGIFIASVMALFAFPALFAGGVMLLFDNLLGTSFFIPAVTLFGQQLPREGGNPLLFQHLFWYFGHPEVYVVILPAMGIASDLISTHARKPIFGYKAMVLALAAIAFIGFIVWAHHMFVSGMNPYFGFFFAVSTLIIAIPSAVKVYNWLLTLWRGNIRLNVPMLFGIGWISTFIIGGLTGLPLGNVVADVPLHDTYFVVGHFHLVMGVAALMAIFGGIYHWFPKVTGRMLNETLGKLHFWVTFVGAYAIFFPMFLMGILGVPRRYFDFNVLQYLPPQTHALNIAITVAALAVGAAQLIFLGNLIWSALWGKRAESNPWGATTLEWQTPTTPPPHGNWGAQTPTVYRWAYDYSVPGAERDFIPQNVPSTPTVSTVPASTVR
jgi:cytochrome c oxidase subunit 1